MPTTLQHCPACGAPLSQARSLFSCFLFGQRNCNVLRCSCDLVLKQQIPNAEELAKIYAQESYTHSADFSLSRPSFAAERASAISKLAQIQRFLGKSTFTMLDYGCGYGGFVQITRALGYKISGADPYLPEKRAVPDLQCAHLSDIPDESVDVITMLNIAEHLHEPKPVFAEAFRVLRPGGVVYVTCPYGNALALKRYQHLWSHLQLDDHLLFWTPKSLRAMLQTLGFKGTWHRVAGSPFPLGKGREMSAQLPSTHVQAEPEALSAAATAVATPSVRSRISHFAWRVQSNPHAAKAVRALMHHAKLGDYLAFMAKK
jgi:SAM-dependent methyltransferase